MLVNPFTTTLACLPGSRILTDTFGLLGVRVEDPEQHGRVWTVTSVYGPIRGRRLGGIRVKLEDNKGFVSFCNQRDLEMLVGLASPGDFCCWLDDKYPEWGSEDFYGICSDDEDLRDDLFDRELRIRAEYPGVIPLGYEITRRVHREPQNDAEELHTMLYDCDPTSGYGPDPRFETLSRRWARVQEEKVRWERL